MRSWKTIIFTIASRISNWNSREILIDLDREFRGKRFTEDSNEDEPNDEVERRKSIWSARVSIFFFF